MARSAAGRGARPRVLLAWELGGNLGHVAQLAAVARALGGRAEVWLAMRDPAAFRRFAPDLAAPLLPAPVASLRPRRPDTAPGRSYPDDLRHCGWDDAGTLGALVASWRTILGLVRPDMLVAQAAPTALLAARGTGVALADLGTGYELPPAAAPVPPFLWWRGGGRDAAAEAGEALATGVADRVLAGLGAPALGEFRALRDGVLALLAAAPGLDHYGERRRFEPDPPPPLGAIAATGSGAMPGWLPGERRRVLAYLRAGAPGFEAALGALAGAPAEWDVVLASPGIPDAARARLAGAPVRVVDGPVALGALLAEGCDLGLSHAPAGTAAALAAAGVAQVALPGQAEQLMMARALHAAGIGLVLRPGGDAAALRRLLGDALGDAALRARAAAWAARHPPADAAAAAAELILARLGA